MRANVCVRTHACARLHGMHALHASMHCMQSVWSVERALQACVRVRARACMHVCIKRTYFVRGRILVLPLDAHELAGGWGRGTMVGGLHAWLFGCAYPHKGTQECSTGHVLFY